MIRAVDYRVAKNAAACVTLGCRTLASQRYAAAGSGYVPVRQIGAAVKILAVIARVAVLAQHRNAHRQHWRYVRSVRCVAIRTVVDNWRMLPKERTALLRVARVAGLVHRFLYQQLRSRRSVRVVAIRTGHLTFEDRVPSPQIEGKAR